MVRWAKALAAILGALVLAWGSLTWAGRTVWSQATAPINARIDRLADQLAAEQATRARADSLQLTELHQINATLDWIKGDRERLRRAGLR